MNILFYTENYKYLAEKLNSKGFFKLGSIEHKIFADGESYLRIEDEIKGQNVYIIGGTISDSDTLELYDLGCAISKYGAETLNFIVPYFGYSTMERAVKMGEVVKAKTRARLFSSIPRANKGNFIYLYDLHTEAIVHYFGDSIYAENISSNYIFPTILSKIEDDIIIAAPDAGRVKYVTKLGLKFHKEIAVVLKTRIDGVVKNLAINANVLDRDILIYDDMIRSGSTIVEAINAYKKAGARKIYLFFSHGVFSSSSILENKDIEKIFVTNSLPQVNKFNSEKLEVIDISEILFKRITR